MSQISPVVGRYAENYPPVYDESNQLEQEEGQTGVKDFRPSEGPRLGLTRALIHSGASGNLEDKDWVLLAPQAAWAGTGCSKRTLHLGNTHFKFSFLLSFEYCVSTDRPPTSKVSQQPPVPPQRPMAALPPLPTGRNSSVSLLPFFQATLYP